MALRALAEFDFDYVEQPVPPGDIAALARLRAPVTPFGSRRTNPPRRRTVRCALLESGAVDVLVLKPAMLGGPARALEIAHACAQAGCDVVFSHAFESAVGARHALHCAAAWGDARRSHGLCTAGLFVDDVAEPVDCHDGRRDCRRRARPRDRAVNLGLALRSRVARTPDAPAIEGGGPSLDFRGPGRARAAWRGAHLLAVGAAGDAPIAMLLPGDARFVAMVAAPSLARAGRSCR